MSEGPPKKDEAPIDTAPKEPEDPIAIFDELYALFGDIDSWVTKPSGSAIRAVKALNAGYKSIEYAFKTGQEIGPAYVQYTKNLQEVLSEPTLWTVLRSVNGEASVQTLRNHIQEHLVILESQMIDNFKFTGRKQ